MGRHWRSIDAVGLTADVQLGSRPVNLKQPNVFWFASASGPERLITAYRVSANTGLCVLAIARRCAHALSKFAPDTNSGAIEHEENSFCCCSSYDGLGTSSRSAMSPSYADGHPGRPTCLQRLGRPRNAGALWRR